MAKMVQRLLLALPIFFGLSILLFLLRLIQIRRAIKSRRATGFGFALGSSGEIFLQLVVLLLLAIVAFWASSSS